MTEYIATCNSDEDDTITARVDGRSVELVANRHGRHMMETYLLTSDARTFARGILTLADEIDGGEVVEAPAPGVAAKWGTIQPGDTVRVLVDDAECATVRRGDKFTVHSANAGTVTVHDGRGDFWYFSHAESIELVDDVPAESPADEPAPVLSTHAAHVRNAKTLLADTAHTAADIVRLAEFLAAE